MLLLKPSLVLCDPTETSCLIPSVWQQSQAKNTDNDANMQHTHSVFIFSASPLLPKNICKNRQIVKQPENQRMPLQAEYMSIKNVTPSSINT